MYHTSNYAKSCYCFIDVIYSWVHSGRKVAWQFLYWYGLTLSSPNRKQEADKYEGYIQKVPELVFYSALPMVWDDARVLERYPGR